MMARSEARVLVEIWDDPDFIALNVEDQRNYLFLLSQRDTAHTGVVPLRERRWSNAAADSTAANISESLQRLDKAGFVVVDESTEEVLVRSLIRRDKIFRQPNVLRAAQDQLAQIASRRIRAALLAELDRIAASEQVTGQAAGVLEAMRADLTKGTGNPSGNPPDIPTPNPSGNPSGNPTSGTPGERGVVTASSSDSPSPFPLPSEPREPAPPAPAREPRKTKRGTRIPDDFQVTPPMVSWAQQNTPHVDGRRETEKFINYWRAKSGSNATKLDWAATWRNWMLTAAERASPPTDGLRTTTRSRDGRIPANERCPTHRGHHKDNCGPCRADQMAARRPA